MNVLVYDGPGVSAISLAHTLSCMKALLLPHYAVQVVSASALASQPWEGACALLIIPGGRDLPYVSALAAATARIKSYVQRGGAFLGICAGAYYASRRVEWETGTKLEVAGDRPLAFFAGVCRGSVYPGFAYEDERGARAVAVEDAETAEVVRGMYHNGGGEFVRAETSAPATDVLARYVDGEGSGKTAAVLCRVGKGVAVLWGTHPEYSLFDEPLISALKKREPQLSHDDVKTAEGQRWKLLRKSLTKLGLRLPDNSQGRNNSVSSLLPQFLTSSVPGLPTRVFNLLSANATTTIPKILQDNNDTFHLHMSPSAAHILRDARARPGDPGNLQSSPKHIIFFLQDELPLPELTPYFSTREYYSDLSSVRTSHVLEVVDNDAECGFGELLLYGEAVTSTQTMLDKNPKFLRSLSAPLLSLATHQLSGRGRGANIWLSPAGCLQFSLLLRPSLSAMPAARLVFIQYLCGLAVVEACRELMGDSGTSVRLKWPNDIYALVSKVGEDGKRAQETKKIGGILVNTNFSGGHVDVVIGCGLNVLNGPPMTSLSQLTSRKLTMEKTIATIMVVFEEMWRSFVADGGSFERFMDLYLERWLHSDQLVTLATTSPAPLAVRIVGITPDHGLLRTLPEHGDGAYIDLQPDGNSFDMMAGLIKSKT